MYAQFDRSKAHFPKFQHLLGPARRITHLAGGGIDRCAARQLPAEHLPQGLPLDLPLDVPESRLQPVIPPAQVAGLADALPPRCDVGRIEPDQIGAQQAAETLPLALEGDARREPLRTVIGRQAGQGKTIGGLRIAGYPGGMKRFLQRDGDVEQFDAVEFHPLMIARAGFPALDLRPVRRLASRLKPFLHSRSYSPSCSNRRARRATPSRMSCSP